MVVPSTPARRVVAPRAAKGVREATRGVARAATAGPPARPESRAPPDRASPDLRAGAPAARRARPAPRAAVGLFTTAASTPPRTAATAPARIQTPASAGAPTRTRSL